MSIIVGILLYAARLMPEIDQMLNKPGFVPILLAILAGLSRLIVLLCRPGFGMGGKLGLQLKEKAATGNRRGVSTLPASGACAIGAQPSGQ